MKIPKIALLLIAFFIVFGCNKEKEKDSKSEEIQNRLAQSSSPYLKEHADNPVDWYEWGTEALEKAEKENKPLIISVGYSACHWCHVMEEESFMDDSIAAIMNKNFVSIKIDREQRPDIDEMYMQAATLLNGSGGWPLNVFALPDGKPFYAGTYFSKDDWKMVLMRISKTYEEDKSGLVSTASELVKGVRKVNSLDTLNIQKSTISKQEYTDLIKNWEGTWDINKGGYNGKEKFPLPVSWSSLLEYYHITKDQRSLEMVDKTLDQMARGGIYDHLAGGFSRYTVDARWRVPHFEKMLYDNALLVSLYSDHYKLFKNEQDKKIVVETLNFIEKELSNGQGGYYSSVNADSEGEEGKYYAWTKDEVQQILSGDELKFFMDFYNIEGYGNWENKKNILYQNQSLREFADEVNVSYSELKPIIDSAKIKLLRAREKRKKPAIDHKIITSWNALMIQAHLDAYQALGDPVYLEKALVTANFLKDELMNSDFHLKRSLSGNDNSIHGFSEDYAYLSKAYLELYQVNFDKSWLDLSEGLMLYAIENFRDEESGMFNFNSRNHKEIFVNGLDLEDDVIPSSNSVFAENLLIIGNLKYKQEYIDLSDKMLGNIWPRVKENPFSYANWVSLAAKKSFSMHEIAIVGEDALAKNKELQSNYLPSAIFMGGTKENLPLLESKLVAGETFIYVCVEKTCKFPVKSAVQALELINIGDQNKSESQLNSPFSIIN